MSESKRFFLIGLMCLAIALSFEILKVCLYSSVHSKVKVVNEHIENDEPLITVEGIENSIHFRLAYHGRQLRPNEIERLAQVLYVGHVKYNINYYDVISLISTESEWKKTAKGKNPKSMDYGLTQQNSHSINYRYKVAARILDSHGITYNKNDKFDVALNVMSCIWYLNAIRKEIGDGYSHHRMISSYNTGVVGYKRLPRIANAYYTRFTKMKSI